MHLLSQDSRESNAVSMFDPFTRPDAQNVFLVGKARTTHVHYNYNFGRVGVNVVPFRC